MSNKFMQEEIKSVFINYLDTYFLNRNLQSTMNMFSHNITGFGTGLDEESYNYNDFKTLYERDLSQAPNAIHYEILKFHINHPTNDVGIISSILNIQTHICNQEVKFNNLRLSVIIIKGKGEWKMEHMHISFPTEAHKDDEAYPIKELEDRNKVLQRLVDEKTEKLNDAIKSISILATTDKLTGLFNRLKIDEYFNNEVQRAHRYCNKLSIILIDIDFFKNVNDVYGHLSGDQVLIEFARILSNRIRNTDIVGRWGGEEFIVISPETSLEQATQLAEDIRCAVESHQFSTVKNITASFGVSSYTQNDTIKEILSRADIALYDAKRSGRNQVMAKSNSD